MECLPSSLLTGTFSTPPAGPSKVVFTSVFDVAFLGQNTNTIFNDLPINGGFCAVVSTGSCRCDALRPLSGRTVDTRTSFRSFDGWRVPDSGLSCLRVEGKGVFVAGRPFRQIARRIPERTPHSQVSNSLTVWRTCATDGQARGGSASIRQVRKFGSSLALRGTSGCWLIDPERLESNEINDIYSGNCPRISRRFQGLKVQNLLYTSGIEDR